MIPFLPRRPLGRFERLGRLLRDLGRLVTERHGFEPIALAPRRDYSLTGTGQAIYHHPPEVCSPWPCPFHAPSDHHMTGWLTHLRHDLPLVERVCPDHGAVHPDPDSVRYLMSHPTYREGWYLGCDCTCGCCHTPRIGAPIVDGG